MLLKSQLLYGQHTLDVIVLNGGFWFSARDLGPCFGLTGHQMADLYDKAESIFTPETTRLFEVDSPEGNPLVSRIFSQRGVHILATRTESRDIERFIQWLDGALCEHPLFGLGVDASGEHHNAEERLMRAMAGLRGVISLMYANTTDPFALNPHGVATLLDLVHSELKGVVPAVQNS